MRKGLFFSILCLFVISIQAQKNGTVKGVAFDTISQQPVAAATISVLSQKDSSLISFTMTGMNGAFQLNGLANGDYRLLLTHVNYHNSNTWFSITDSNKQVDLRQCSDE